MARLRTLVLVVAIVALATVAGATSGAAAPVAAAPAGECPGQVAVVVDFGGGDLVVRCAAAGGSGIDVLRRAGFSVVAFGFASEGGDAAVCALGRPGGGPQVGCAADSDCLKCQAPDAWGYYPGYRYSQVGAGDTRPGACTIEAWRWGRSSSWGASKLAYSDVCPPAPPPSTAPPATSPPAATVPPATSPPSGGGTTPSDPGGARPGAADPTTPSGGAATAPTDGSGATPGAAGDGDATSTEPGASPPDSASTSGPAGDDDTAVAGETETRASDDDGGSEDERADGVGTSPISATGSGGSGGGPPFGSFVAAALLVAVVGGLALRARSRRRDASSA